MLAELATFYNSWGLGSENGLNLIMLYMKCDQLGLWLGGEVL